VVRITRVFAASILILAGCAPSGRTTQPAEASPVFSDVRGALDQYLSDVGFDPVDDSWPAPRVAPEEALSIALEQYRAEVAGLPAGEAEPAPIGLLRRVSADFNPPQTRWLVVFEFPDGFPCLARDGRTRAPCPVGMVFVVNDQTGEYLGRLVEWQ
jgi:hypothetical protein